ncbi:MAG TPA: hypothetical protein VNT99_06965, partial [Methylomirabilota bacterium]|nr:hypothetical protein [Methylomirabilota bacterium]
QIATDEPQSVTSAGAVVTLEKVTYGKEHRFVHGSLWQRLRARLPEKWFGKSGAVMLTHRTTNDVAVAWMVWKGSSVTNVAMLPYFSSYIVVNGRDELLQITRMAALHRIGKEVLDARELVLPRQGKSVRLRLYDFATNSHRLPVGEFKISNPSRKDPLEWKPEQLPIRRTGGNVEFTLSQFTAGTEVRADRRLLTALNKLTFQIAENGQRTTNWQLRSIYASDALGNQNVYGVGSYPDRNGDESWEGYWLLWPDEPAWKLRLEFVRRGGFAPDERWLVEGIPVPGRDSFTPKTFQTNLQGVLLVVRGISDAQGLLPDGQMSVNATSNVLDMKWSPSREGTRVSLLEVKDESGQKLVPAGSVGGDHGQIGYRLNIASNVHSVNALFAVHRNRVVEFLAKPELISTNSSSARGGN